MAAFSVESLAICDFVTQDRAGRQVLIGIYQGEIRFVTVPPQWPSFYISLVIDPRERQFKFDVDFRSEARGTIMKMSCDYSADTDPRQENRFVLNWQLPSIPFTGEGDYVFVVREGGSPRSLFRQKVPVRIGHIEPLQVKVEASVEIQIGANTSN